MNTRKVFEKCIVKASSIKEVGGYVRDYRDNTLDSIDSSEYESDLMEGAGSELKTKFSAIYSSSALVVNVFASFKKYHDKINLLGYENFYTARFERTFPTGLGGTPPTLDFCIENKEVVIGIESKYLEILTEKESKFTDSYYSTDCIANDQKQLIKQYAGRKGLLDYAQLIKHSIGMSKYAIENNKKAIILYLYWKPINFNSFPEYKQHASELELFKKNIGKINTISFMGITYYDIWENYSNNKYIGRDIAKTRERYEIKID